MPGVPIFLPGHNLKVVDRIHVGDQVIGYDPQQTRKLYSATKAGYAEKCGCSYCGNFAAQRTTAYPENFRLLLGQLGIDPEKESELYEGGPAGQLRMYGGWFYFVGELIEAGERMRLRLTSNTFCKRKTSAESELEFGKVFWRLSS